MKVPREAWKITQGRVLRGRGRLWEEVFSGSLPVVQNKMDATLPKHSSTITGLSGIGKYCTISTNNPTIGLPDLLPQSFSTETQDYTAHTVQLPQLRPAKPESPLNHIGCPKRAGHKHKHSTRQVQSSHQSQAPFHPSPQRYTTINGFPRAKGVCFPRNFVEEIPSCCTLI
jgi:hypothetical protein